MPFWGEVQSQAPDGSSLTSFEGSDYQLLVAVAAVLNFTFRVLPSTSWAEVGLEEVKFSCGMHRDIYAPHCFD